MSGSASFPNLHWAWRMPLKRLSWGLAWWLMKRVTMRGYTRHQQARMISDALGAYRPKPVPSRVFTGSNATNVVVRFNDDV